MQTQANKANKETNFFVQMVPKCIFLVLDMISGTTKCKKKKIDENELNEMNQNSSLLILNLQANMPSGVCITMDNPANGLQLLMSHCRPKTKVGHAASVFII